MHHDLFFQCFLSLRQLAFTPLVISTHIIQSPVSANLSVTARYRWDTAAVTSYICVVLRHGRTCSSLCLLPLSSNKVWNRFRKFSCGTSVGQGERGKREILRHQVTLSFYNLFLFCTTPHVVV